MADKKVTKTIIGDFEDLTAIEKLFLDLIGFTEDDDDKDKPKEEKVVQIDPDDPSTWPPGLGETKQWDEFGSDEEEEDPFYDDWVNPVP